MTMDPFIEQQIAVECALNIPHAPGNITASYVALNKLNLELLDPNFGAILDQSYLNNLIQTEESLEGEEKDKFIQRMQDGLKEYENVPQIFKWNEESARTRWETLYRRYLMPKMLGWNMHINITLRDASNLIAQPNDSNVSYIDRPLPTGLTQVIGRSHRHRTMDEGHQHTNSRTNNEMPAIDDVD